MKMPCFFSESRTELLNMIHVHFRLHTHLGSMLFNNNFGREIHLKICDFHGSLRIETCFSEMSINIFQSILRHIPENNTPQRNIFSSVVPICYYTFS
jgi:hypothetical protein